MSLSAFLKTYKTVLTWTALGLLALIIVLFVYLRISATLHFSLQTELLMTHTPSQVAISTTHNTTTTIQIQTSVDTFHACDSVCDYETNTGYSIRNQSAKSLTHMFTVQTPERGFGQKLVYFKSSCHTIQSTFCPSTGTEFNQTSLVIVNYNLQPFESQLVANSTQLLQTLRTAASQIENMRYAKQLFDVWPQPTVVLRDDKELSGQITTATRAWKQQDYATVFQTWQNINTTLNGLTNNDTVPTLLSQIATYKELQQNVAMVLNNESIREYISYAQTYDTQAGIARQAVNRLATILLQTYIDNLTRAQFVATGASQFLANATESYLQDKTQAIQTIALARTVLPVIKTALTNLPLDVCNATNALREHNLWVMQSNLTILNTSVVQTLVQPTNATYLFELPQIFCVPTTEQVSIAVEKNYSPKSITLPVFINLSMPQLPAPQATCMLGSSVINCTKSHSPILFIHGHSFDESNSPQISMMAFGLLQERLEELSYVNAGELVSQTGQSPILPPITVRASYYYIQQYGVGSYAFEIQKSERIENYALRLKEIIEDVKKASGSPNVTIIAHSMGGLVTREYVNLFGTDSIDRVITINTPHQGIVGQVASICNLLGAAKECEDMTANSTFLRRLPPITGQWDVIASTGCTMKDGVGDGVVLASNSVLPGAKYHLLNGTCTDALSSNLHTQMLEDSQLYQLIKKLLQ